ncbi:hypothetical protein F5Y14DRAFT_376633 [Nemania sp. NC0429]|nr:hypothetical protein F5Y14DRAFT_376633 [Nemania sp. NC0429]
MDQYELPLFHQRFTASPTSMNSSDEIIEEIITDGLIVGRRRPEWTAYEKVELAVVVIATLLAFVLIVEFNQNLCSPLLVFTLAFPAKLFLSPIIHVSVNMPHAMRPNARFGSRAFVFLKWLAGVSWRWVHAAGREISRCPHRRLPTHRARHRHAAPNLCVRILRQI